MVRCWPSRRKIVPSIITGLICGIVILTILHVRLEDEAQGFQESPSEHESLDMEDDFDNVLHYHHETDILMEDIEEFAIQHVGNLPDLKYLQSSLMRSSKASNCGQFPDLYQLEFNNLHWQVQYVSNLTFYLYRAYYDHRVTGKGLGEDGIGVRVLALVNEPIGLEADLHCQFWYAENPTPRTVGVALKYPIWFKAWSKKGKYTPYILTCYAPTKGDGEEPISVSVVQKSCDQATNNLRIENRKNGNKDREGDRKGRFGVCVKGLDFLHSDQSLRLIEWIELLHVLGAEKVFFYEFAVHPNVKKVLQYYEREGLVEVTPITLPGNLPNEPNLRHLYLSHKDHSSDKRKNEVIPYNDCLYRNLDNYEFLAVLDTDEVIMPKKGSDWNDLIEQIESTTASGDPGTRATSYCFRNIYFFDSIPENDEEDGDAINEVPSHLHMMKHVYRAANYTPPKKFIKCFHSTARTALLHNHFPLGCLEGSCIIQHVDTEVAQLQHYRSTCVKDLKNCDEYEKTMVKDKTIWRFKGALTSRTTSVAKSLHLI